MRLVFLRQIKHTTRTVAPHRDDVGCRGLERWFTEKKPSTFNTLCSLQHLASGIVKATMSLPRIWWKDQTTWRSLLYRGDLISLDRLEDMFRSLEETTVKTWKGSVLRGRHLHVDYDTIKEDLAADDIGYCFLNDPRNKAFHHRTILLETITDDPELRDVFLLKQGSSYLWKADALRGWLTDYSVLQGLLMLRCEMLAGGPARATEMGSMKFRSTATRRVRNLSVLGTHLAMLTTYHKSGAMTGTDRLIPHSIDAFTADLIIQSLAIARPFAEMAAQVCFPQRADIHALYRDGLFVNFDRPFDTDTLSELMRRHTQPSMGVGLTINPWRHISIAFRRKLCRGASDLFEDEQDLESVDALMSGHSRAQENRTYGISAESLAGPGEDILPLYLTASTDWHVVTHTVPGGVMLPYEEAMGKYFADLTRVGVIGHIQQARKPSSAVTEERVSHLISEMVVPIIGQEIQSAVKDALTQVMAQLHIAPPDEVPRTVGDSARRASSSMTGQEAKKRAMPSPSSPSAASPTHSPLSRAALRRQRKSTLSSSSSSSGGSMHASVHRSTPPFRPARPSVSPSLLPPPFSPEIMEELALAPTVPIDQELAEDRALEVIGGLVQKPFVDWSCTSQREAMMAVLSCRTDVIAVLPTNAGKSMLMIVPSILEEDMVTVGILPLKSLLFDFQRKLDKMGVAYEIWTGDGHGRLGGQKNLILVLIDQVIKPSWRQAIAELNETRAVRRYVFDEAHYALTASNFRDCLQDVYAIRQFSAQFVLMSGTIPPTSEESLKTSFGLLNDTKTIRADLTGRPEIQYILEPLRDSWEQIFLRTQQILEHEVAEFRPVDRGLVFVPFKEKGFLLARYLHCQFYCGGGDLTDDVRRDVYQKWVSGHHKVMVCTSAFGAGNDYPHVRVVIHAGNPYELVGYIQESGRAGRDKAHARSHVLPGPWPLKRPLLPSSAPHAAWVLSRG
ncbi:P-loop containing nucleoside triphosphate hydrolase protein [Daedalea quercina L-15889]|uniref:DNA 3'-5' helicase n=1 Tax=Daedalea quercina L-15889 TaxID=1314783 RepID=A0A165KFX1_9APHY|nr:P-loop containing nucleoside triphosphate hydrolase protein [Daedalea quercina L-15889]